MSTSYYTITPIIDEIHHEKKGPHNYIHFFINGQHSGVITIYDNEVAEFLSLFADRGFRVAHTHYGGVGRGKVLSYNDPLADDDTQLISENGELTTLGQLKESCDVIL